ncbi:DNA topoisomerase I [uncultured Gimesia sp.]|uniref:DNA topoisomerase I n=1 Tax=uncultured Gimesia sp. TaxID=1678688 RepID=UPI00260A103E|nr:DNA topoisomerase I [uncultured Gimesia sp.]
MLTPFDQLGIIVGGFFRILFANPYFRNLLKPLTRFFIGLIAIPIFHLILNKVVRVQEIDEELEKDLEQWFRGSLLLLAATANMEAALFGWVPMSLQGTEGWILMGFRIMLAIGVIEAMPDQELFSIIHPGPPPLKLSKEYGIFRELKEKWRVILKGLVCQHVNRSSPVFAILAAIAVDTVGWVCYGIAITQYLIIGLVTSRDRALDVLSEFDRKVSLRRRELIEEFDLNESDVKQANQKKREAEAEQAAVPSQQAAERDPSKASA